jgi:16S rRNA G966 N2-methylase RsmD
MRTQSSIAPVDTRIIYCGDCIDQLRKLPAECVDLIYIDPPFNSNRNYEVFWGETKEKRAFEDTEAEQLVKHAVLRLIEAEMRSGTPVPELPVWDLGAIGPLHRCDLYDDAG